MNFFFEPEQKYYIDFILLNLMQKLNLLLRRAARG